MRKIQYFKLLVLLLSISSCDKSVVTDEYANLSHSGVKDIRVTAPVIDTILVDASATSMNGDWLIKNGKLFFMDLSIIGIYEFDTTGNLINNYIHKGNGPDEVTSQFVAGTFFSDGNFIAIDNGWAINLFDSHFKRKGKPYRLHSDIVFDESNWNDLLKNPNPEEMMMYEFFIGSKGIGMLGEQIIVPVITEHVDYNGYNKGANSKDFWVKSYNFLMIDIANKKVNKLFGHYPPIFRDKNIPMFSDISFDISQNMLYTSYAADSLIYIRNGNGEMVGSIGYNSFDVANDYPETVTFDDYSSSLRNTKKDYGYYGTIKAVNNHIFRSYKKKDDKGYGVQIYFENDLIGDISFSEKVNVIGHIDDYYYAALPVDMDSEQFRLIKFKVE